MIPGVAFNNNNNNNKNKDTVKDNVTLVKSSMLFHMRPRKTALISWKSNQDSGSLLTLTH